MIDPRAVTRYRDQVMPGSGFFATLNYSSCNEDWKTERAALRIGAGDRVLCVTGSGDRPLHLLLDAPASVVAIDANPAQGRLLALKAAALAELDFERYRSYLGFRDEGDRLALHARVAPRLTTVDRDWWAERASLISRGVLYQGRWERHYRRLAAAARLLRGRLIDRLFELDSLEEQREFVRSCWDRPAWRLTYRLLCSRAFSRVFFGDPAFYRNVTPGLGIGDYVYDRMLGSLERRLARRNFMLSLLFRGRITDEDLPPYLSREAFEPLRRGLAASKLSTRTQPLTEYLESQAAGAFTRLSLSDVPSYLDKAGWERLLAAMLGAAAPGARFCIRLFLTGHEIPEPLRGRLRREPELERELEARDRCFAYRFIVGTVEAP
jgi:S-adenosylmethionine-diacylglycerol 3-amino-3-carboxypropyl transferase